MTLKSRGIEGSNILDLSHPREQSTFTPKPTLCQTNVMGLSLHYFLESHVTPEFTKRITLWRSVLSR